MKSKEGLVGIINSVPTITDFLEFVVQEGGFRTATADFNKIKEDTNNYHEFLAEYNPIVILFDIPPPYKENWEFVQQLENLPDSQGRGFVNTTQGATAVKKLMGQTSQELVGLPCELDEILRAVERTYTLTLKTFQQN